MRRYVHFFCCIILLLIVSAGCAKRPPDDKLSRIRDWQEFINDARFASTRQKLLLVNSYFNRFQYVEDRDLYGKRDHWATLLETLSRKSGDCEDFAIAKYFTLRDMDFAEENMRITYVIPVQTSKPHMVLTYMPDGAGEPLVLDSRVKDVLPVSRRDDLVPVYSFNMLGYWIAKKDAKWQGERVGAASKLSLWWALLQRMKKEDTLYTSKPVDLTGG